MRLVTGPSTPGGFAGGLRPARRLRDRYSGNRRRSPGRHGHRRSRSCRRPRRRSRECLAHGEVVDEKAGFEVSVPSRMTSAPASSSRRFPGFRSETQASILMPELAARRCRRAASALGSPARVLLGVEHLALQIAFLNVIAVDQAQGSHAGARQQRRMDGSQRAASCDYRGGGGEPSWPAGPRGAKRIWSAKAVG